MHQPLACGFLILCGDGPESFLLMKHPHRWDLPKGHRDPGESELQCALRELEEETGITADAIQIETEFRFELQYPVDQKRYGGEGVVMKTLVIFMARLPGQVTPLLTEHEGAEWIPWCPPHYIQENTIDPLLRAAEEYLQTQ